MLIPNNRDILAVVTETFKNVIKPAVHGDQAVSAAQTLEHLLRFVGARLDQEPAILAREVGSLRSLLPNVRDYLNTLAAEPGAKEQSGQISTTLTQQGTPSGAESENAIKARVGALRESLYAALSFLIGIRERHRGDTRYQAIRQSIREYSIAEINAEAALVELAFLGRGPRR